MPLDGEHDVENERLPELVDDREVTKAESDRFRHRDVADELATLAATVDTPANVALYGPWGSGKTGVANLLRDRFKEKEFRKEYGVVRFARFDAFKYAEIPLRRHFLSQMATELLDKKASKDFRDSLYRSESKTDISFSSLDVWRAVRVFLLLLAVGLAIAVLITGLTAGAVTRLADEGGDEFWDRYKTYFAGVIGFSFAPAAVLGGLFAIAGKSLPVTRQSDVPSTDEEFERKFKDLVADSGAERLAVFVDELDRCPADRVVDVLDTVRTFLDVDGTIFIVAADQHVLEQALTRKVQQTTPADTTNPYYSSGSAYLDKVFHYQMSLPPLLPGRVTKYAIELVERRDGVWADDRVNVPWVISVLVPTHVRSPRRVKALVNNFVLTYRLARQRFNEGHLTSDPTERVLELAKLVALRTEFPTFARELTLSSRLPQLFLQLADDANYTQPPEVSDEVWNKVKRFADDDLPVDATLDSRDQEQSPDPADDTVEEDDEAETAAPRTTRAALRQQLHHYLHKTRTIPNPGQDLVFLEARGNLFDLDESLVEEIEDAAVEGRSDDVRATVDQQDVSTQTNVIRLLSQRTMSAFPGVEGANLVGVLLAVVADRSDEVLEDSADDAIGAVNAHLVHSEIITEHLAGAFILGLRSARHGAEQLVATVLETNTASDADLGNMILTNADRLSDQHLDRLASITMSLLTSIETSAGAANALIGLEHPDRVLDATKDPLRDRLAASVEHDKNPEIEEEKKGRVNSRVGALEAALEQCGSQASAPVAEFLLRSSLSAEHPDFWGSAAVYADHVHEEALSEEVLTLLVRRSPAASPTRLANWLGPVPDTFAAGRNLEGDLVRAIERLWKNHDELGAEYAEHDENFLASLAAVARVQDPSVVADRTTGTELIAPDLGGAPINLAQAQTADTVWGHARRFVDAGVIPGATVADTLAELLAAMVATAPQPPPNPPQTDPYKEIVTRWVFWAEDHWAPDAGQAAIDALKNSPWIGSPNRESLALRAAAATKDRHTFSSPYTPDEVATIASEHRTKVKLGISSWLTTFADDTSLAYPVIEPYLRSDVGFASVSAAVKKYVGRLSDDQRLELARMEIERSSTRRIRADFLRAVKFSEVDDLTGADLIVAEYDRTGSNNDRRRDLLDAWDVLQATSPTARTRLVDGVMLPMLADGGKTGLEHVRVRMHLVQDPKGRKNALKDAMRSIVGGKGKDDRLEQAMKNHRIVREKSGPLGIGKREVDE